MPGGSFLLHYLWSRLRRTLSGILPCEARTFLVWHLSDSQPRPFALLTSLSYIGIALLSIATITAIFFPNQLHTWIFPV